MFLLGGSAVTAELPVQPLSHVPDALRSWYNVERRWNRSTLLEVTDPELASGELPFHVRAFLNESGKT